MLTKESLNIKGNVTIRPFILNQGVKVYDDEVFRSNMVVTIGRKMIVDFLTGEFLSEAVRLRYIKWGTGTGVVVSSDTGLSVEIENSQRVLNDPQKTDTTITYTHLITGAEYVFEDRTITEAGIFFGDNSAVSREMFARVTFPGVTLTSIRGLELEWTFEFTIPNP